MFTKRIESLEVDPRNTGQLIFDKGENNFVVQLLSRVRFFATPTISSSVTLFSSCPQSFPALMFSSESAFCIKQPKSSSFSFSQSSQSSFLHQASRASALASVLPMSIQGWFPLGLTGLISLLSKGLSRVLFSTTVWKHQFFGTQPSLWSNS